MKSSITKSVPNSNSPCEVLRHYKEHIIRWVHLCYKEYLQDLSGNKRKQRFSKLMKIKGIGAGKTAFVLASGPSINKLDPNKIRKICDDFNSEILCVNYFVNSEFAKTTGVDYWLLSDPRHFDLSLAETVNAHDKANQIVRKALFVSEFFLGKANQVTNLNIIPFNDNETSSVFSRNIDPCFPRAYLTMSAYKALAMAIYIGYDKIYIGGFDNSYIRDLGCDKDNILYRRINQFYGSQDDNMQPTRDYKMGLGINEKPRKRNVAEELLAYSRLFSDLYGFSKFDIVNLDPDSLTDAFPKFHNLDIYK
jgi:hypothetical protein